jgi:hypothetical protein
MKPGETNFLLEMTENPAYVLPKTSKTGRRNSITSGVLLLLPDFPIPAGIISGSGSSFLQRQPGRLSPSKSF